MNCGRLANTKTHYPDLQNLYFRLHMYCKYINCVLQIQKYDKNTNVDELLIEQPRNSLIFKALVLHHVTPVTGRVTDRKKDGFVFVFSPLECLFAPRIPGDGIVLVLKQIRARLGSQFIRHIVFVRFCYLYECSLAGNSPDCTSSRYCLAASEIVSRRLAYCFTNRGASVVRPSMSVRTKTCPSH